MSLIAALNIGETALTVQQLGLTVTGHNIANVNTEGYTRQRLDMVTAQPIGVGNLIVGAGVQPSVIQQTLDRYLNERIRLADSTLSYLGVQRETLERIEMVLGELTDTDLSTAVSRFFDAVQDLANNPEDVSTRAMLIQTAEGFVSEVQTIYRQLDYFRDERIGQAEAAVGEINRLIEDIADLNVDIAALESEPSPQTANDLRDQRDRLLGELTRLVSIKSYEGDQGMVNVYAGNFALVQGSSFHRLESSLEVVDGVAYPVVEFERDGAELPISGGRLLGLTQGGEAVVARALSDLDAFVSNFIYEVNRVHSQGRGLVEYGELTSGGTVRDATAVLTDAGLPFVVKNGSFDFNVVNKLTGEVRSFNIKVDLDGVGADSTLQSVLAEFAAEVTAAYSEITATTTGAGRVVIRSSSEDYGFTFGTDTSGLLTSLGLNTFFTGSNSTDIGVNPTVANNSQLLAAARSGSPGDNTNALALADLRLRGIEGLNGATFSDFYQGVVSRIASSTANAQALEQNQAALLTSLQSERERISGVSIDEETVRLIAYQQGFQAAAKFISVIDEMLDTLMAL